MQPLGPWLRKNFWIVPLPLVAIAALLNAQGVSELIGTVLAPEDASHMSPHHGGLANRTQASSSAGRGAKSADAILTRNPFDHVTGSLKPPSTTTLDPDVASSSSSPSSTMSEGDLWSVPTCDGIDVQAIAASEDQDWSFTSLSSSADKKRYLRRRGGEIGGKKVVFIGRDRVWFSSAAVVGGGAGQQQGTLCQAILFDKKANTTPPAGAASTPAPSARPAVAAAARGAKPLDPELRKGIQAVSATEFNIDRGVVDKIMENQSELMRQARIVPEQENGRVIGIRLLGIRNDSLLGVLGMQNGDRLQTINGFEMGSPEKALEAYARLRTADKLTIQINRGGKNMNLDYNIK